MKSLMVNGWTTYAHPMFLEKNRSARREGETVVSERSRRQLGQTVNEQSRVVNISSIQSWKCPLLASLCHEVWFVVHRKIY